jgi:hypothetical protein
LIAVILAEQIFSGCFKVGVFLEVLRPVSHDDVLAALFVSLDCVLRIFEACERLRARRKPGTAIAARSAMIATTIMISTSVKPARLVVSFLNIA